MIKTGRKSEKAILVGIKLPRITISEVEDNLDELAELAKTAGADVSCIVIQERNKPDSAYFIGKGKVSEIADLISGEDNGIVIFDDNLSPAQQRNLENVIKKKVIDRTNLILDIFAKHARSREGKLQVELAQLQYMLPRLTNLWSHLSRLGGGIGTRGPGETQLEVDRRHARNRLGKIKSEIAKVMNRREIQRKNRKSVPLPMVALVGYTNAGKSTLFNTLTRNQTQTADKLFATLDPLIRKISLPNNLTVLVSDTVGFIRKLPHQLIAAFRATLEEVIEADILLHVIDISHPNADKQTDSVNEVLETLGCDDKPVILINNKIDLLESSVPVVETVDGKTVLNISSLEGTGIGELIQQIEKELKFYTVHMNISLPYSESELIQLVHSHGNILNKSFDGSGINLEIEIGKRISSKLDRYVIQ